MRLIITTHARDGFGRIDPVSLYRPADQSAGLIPADRFLSMLRNFYPLEIHRPDKYPLDRTHQVIYPLKPVRG